MTSVAVAQQTTSSSIENHRPGSNPSRLNRRVTADPVRSANISTRTVSNQNESALNETYFDAPATPDEVLNSHGCCDETCAPRCCYNYCCDPCRTWTFRAGAIFLHRERPDNQPLISDPAIAGSGINANGFNHGWGTGIDTSLIRQHAFQTNNDLELRYA